MFSQTDYEEDDVLETLFSTSRGLLHEMFYERSFDKEKLNRITSLLWDDFSPDLPHWFMALGQPGELNSYLLAHSVNTAILVSQLYRAHDGFPEHTPEKLTLACLIKDIGMVLVPQSYHLHQEDLSEEQQQKLKIHPMISREFLVDITGDYASAYD